MPDFEFSLPFPPSLNTYRYCHRNRLFTAKKGRDYHEKVIELILEMGLNKERIMQPIVISLVMYPPTKRKFDVSNFLKAYEDSLVKAGFLEDDHWIEYGSIKKGHVIKKGKLLVKVDFKKESHHPRDQEIH
jgi:crossover junction endodeoxyribonuclease RusA